ncbi:helix-turn-helix domain-containing protein [Microbacterium dauci]|uniref:Helix-turn-helix domain-containing protein n=1 Tax=Microbacterium dauci TaxID=3048008 RepID=A0ABT6ZDI9_9MICO|nr:helix-turn-helix domain-containing protein [Microbacterium sp. LX3-4]MDJ1113790.1 helix-turn-helix domain-containing protein [Microbacterium sp. LX3-4]
MPIPTQSPQWGTIATAASLLDVSEKTIRRRISDGEIHAERFGPRLIRVNLTSLQHSGRPLQYSGGDAL